MSQAQQQVLEHDASTPAGWLTVEQAAEALGQDPRHIRRLCAAGKLHAFRQAGDGRSAWLVDPACRPELALSAGMDVSLATAGSELAGLSERKRREIMRRLAIVHAHKAALAQRPRGVNTTEFRRAWLSAHNARLPESRRLGERTLLRWLKRLGEQGITGLIDRRRYAGPATCSKAAWEMFCGLYLEESRPSIPYCHELVAAMAASEGWEWPSLRTVQKWTVERLDPKLKALGRDPRRYRDRSLPYICRDWTQIPAMACWVGDHRQFDVLLPREVTVKDARGRSRREWRWFRPWLTAYLDGRSWMPPTWTISFDAPDGDRVMGTFLKGVLAHGKPRHLYLDNGKDYRMYRFAGGRRRPAGKGERIVAERHVQPVLEMLGVEVTWAIPYNAKAKSIEAFFAIVAERFDKQWATYLGNKPDRRPEDVKKIAKLAEQFHDEGYTLEAFQHAFEAWLTTDYALRKSPAAAAGGLSPLRAFAELRSADFVAVRPHEADLALMLMPSRAVSVTQNGVWVKDFMQFYWADALEGRRAASGRDRNRKVIYRYNPDDSSRIYVFDASGGKFLAIATPYIGTGLNPLAAGEAVGQQMELRRGIAKRQRAEVRRVRTVARNVLLEAARRAAGELGRLDDPATIRLPKGPRVIQFAGELTAASQADRVHGRRRLPAARTGPSAAELLADTDQLTPRCTEPGALELLASLESDNEESGEPDSA